MSRSLLGLLLFGMLLAPAAKAQDAFSCSILAPDSIFYDKIGWHSYIPGEFTVTVGVTNISPSHADSVIVSVRSNPRFRIAGANRKLIAVQMAPMEYIETTFDLVVNPRQVSGIDRLEISISAKGGMIGECRKDIWVEKEYKLDNVIKCPDEDFIIVKFIDTLNTYQPNPFQVPISFVNVGDAPSDSTWLTYIGTPEITPVLNEPSAIEFGWVEPNDTLSHVFNLEIGRRLERDTIVTLCFNLVGKGGLNKDTVRDFICCVDFKIPAARDVEFDLTCENDVDISFEDEEYSPNPFRWSATVRNTGTAKAKNVKAILHLPGAYELEPGQEREVPLGTLDVNEERQVEWNIRVKPVFFPDTAEICINVVDEFQRSVTCCDSIILPATTQPCVEAECAVIPDTIFVDPITGEYLPSSFATTLRVSNPCTAAADSVYAVINITDPDVVLENQSSVQQLVAVELAPNDVEEIRWDLRLTPNETARIVTFSYRVYGANIADYTTECEIYVEAAQLPELICEAESSPVDTVHYNIITRRYEPLTFTAKVTNIGANAMDSIEAFIVPSQRIGLANGETSSKRIPAEMLRNGDSWEVRWNLLPVPSEVGSLSTIRVEFRTGGRIAVCEDWVFIVGIPPLTALLIPSDVVGRHSNTVILPIKIDDASGKDINELNVFVDYDPAKLDFLGFLRDGTLMNEDWAFADVSVPGTLGFEASSDDVRLEGSGDLVRMEFYVRYGLHDDILRTSTVPLEFDGERTEVNKGTIETRLFDGLIYVSGDCLYPLQATEAYVVLDNHPNPFNPATEITYGLPHDGEVTLTVFDNLGREVAVLVDGYRTAGTYAVEFNAGGLPSGIYIYRIETPAGSASEKMLLMK